MSKVKKDGKPIWDLRGRIQIFGVRDDDAFNIQKLIHKELKKGQENLISKGIPDDNILIDIGRERTEPDEEISIKELEKEVREILKNHITEINELDEIREYLFDGGHDNRFELINAENNMEINKDLEIKEYKEFCFELDIKGVVEILLEFVDDDNKIDYPEIKLSKKEIQTLKDYINQQ